MVPAFAVGSSPPRGTAFEIKPPPPKVNLEAIRVINEISKNFSLLLKKLETDRNVDANVADTYFRILAGLKSVIMEKQ